MIELLKIIIIIAITVFCYRKISSYFSKSDAGKFKRIILPAFISFFVFCISCGAIIGGSSGNTSTNSSSKAKDSLEQFALTFKANSYYKTIQPLDLNALSNKITDSDGNMFDPNAAHSTDGGKFTTSVKHERVLYNQFNVHILKIPAIGGGYVQMVAAPEPRNASMFDAVADALDSHPAKKPNLMFIVHEVFNPTGTVFILQGTDENTNEWFLLCDQDSKCAKFTRHDLAEFTIAYYQKFKYSPAGFSSQEDPTLKQYINGYKGYYTRDN